MAAAELIATGTTAANSADVTVVAGTPITVALKAAADGAEVAVKLKDDGAAYNIVGRITSAQPSLMILAPGTYRFSRIAGASCGVFSA